MGVKLVVVIVVMLVGCTKPADPIVQHFDDLRVIESMEQSRRETDELVQRAIQYEIRSMYLPAYLEGC